MAKDRFRDWNLYHKILVTALASIILWIVAWAVLVYDGAFPLEEEMIIHHNTASIWPWIIGDEKRSDWTGELVDIGVLNGDAGTEGSTRLLFWWRKFDRWQAVERVIRILPERVFAVEQNSDIDRRWFDVELVPVAACETKVILKETIRPNNYEDRFWFFSEKEARVERLNVSLNALNRWVKDTSGECNPQ